MVLFSDLFSDCRLRHDIECLLAQQSILCGFLIGVDWILVQFLPVDENVSRSVLHVSFHAPSRLLNAAEALIGYVCFVEVPHQGVIKFVPLLFLVLETLLLLDVAIVVTRVSSARVDHDSYQLVLIVLCGILQSKLTSFCLFRQVILSVLMQIQIMRKLKKVIKFNTHHRVHIKFKSL